jgi:hypothetical protein
MDQKKGVRANPKSIDRRKVADEKKRQRLAAALRENLLKRKQQARGRSNSDPADTTGPKDS